MVQPPQPPQPPPYHVAPPAYSAPAYSVAPMPQQGAPPAYGAPPAQGAALGHGTTPAAAPRSGAERGVPPVALPPCDSEIASTCDKTANYVARNGARFENMVREREGANPKFSFLHEQGEGGPYFKWKVYCIQKQIPLEAQEAILREAFPLPDPDAQSEFGRMLGQLSGSKDHIRQLRSWIVGEEESRGSVDWIMDQLRYRILTNSEFTSRLHIIYVVNDVLHACLKKRGEAQPGQTLPIDGMSVKIGAHMVRLLQPTFEQEASVDNRAKLHKVLGLWRDRGIFPSNEVAAMEAGRRLIPCRRLNPCRRLIPYRLLL